LFELRLKNLEIEAKNAIVESQKRHLQELSEIQNKIISIVAHDVRSPVASLKNMLDLKKSGDISPEEMDDFIVTIGKQMDYTLNLLTNLVKWGSILMKKSSAKLKFLNLNKLVDSEFKKMDISSAAKQNILINEIPIEYLINTDENMLLFILRNLLINAIKFTKSGSITVSATISGDKVKVMVMVMVM